MSKEFTPGRYAAIDIGTVTCRMLVADIDSSGHMTPIAKEYAITNLGEGVDVTGCLSKAALERVRVTIDGYLEVLASLDTADTPIKGITAMATSASRDAKNSDELAALLSQRGIELSVIPGEVEASLSFMGASSGYAGTGQRVMVVDVGGGSTEIAIGVAGETPEWFHSFNVGCRRMTERFWDGYPPSEKAIDHAREWARSEFKLPAAQIKDQLRMIAVAGTATSAVTIRDGIEPYDPSRVNGAVVTLQDLQAIEQKLAVETLPQIESTPGLDPKRAPVITAGLVILEEVMYAAAVSQFNASESDILDGMIMYTSLRL